jgi:DNA polymerase III epsilon subunit-like protein
MANARLSDFLVVAFDFETTGLSAARDRAIQLGAFAKTPAGDVEFDELIFTPKRIQPEAEAVHGISASKIAGRPDFAGVCAKFLDALDAARRSVAHCSQRVPAVWTHVEMSARPPYVYVYAP